MRALRELLCRVFHCFCDDEVSTTNSAKIIDLEGRTSLIEERLTVMETDIALRRKLRGMQ